MSICRVLRHVRVIRLHGIEEELILRMTHNIWFFGLS